MLIATNIKNMTSGCLNFVIWVTQLTLKTHVKGLFTMYIFFKMKNTFPRISKTFLAKLHIIAGWLVKSKIAMIKQNNAAIKCHIFFQIYLQKQLQRLVRIKYLTKILLICRNTSGLTCLNVCNPLFQKVIDMILKISCQNESRL